jgi:hypothetical protein
VSLSADQLLAGGALTQDVAIPPDLLPGDGGGAVASVTVRPLTVRDLQLIAGAVRDDDGLSAALMIQQAVVEPPMRVEQIAQMPAGLARFLVERINAISGIDTPQDALAELVQAPLAKACFVLAKEFGWTPEQVSGMTIGQILLYLEMSRAGESDR